SAGPAPPAGTRGGGINITTGAGATGASVVFAPNGFNTFIDSFSIDLTTNAVAGGPITFNPGNTTFNPSGSVPELFARTNNNIVFNGAATITNGTLVLQATGVAAGTG